MSHAKTQSIRRAAVVICILALLLLIWPAYSLFNRIQPLILGIPFSLFFQVIVLLLVFFTLALLYLWEDRTGDLE